MLTRSLNTIQTDYFLILFFLKKQKKKSKCFSQFCFKYLNPRQCEQVIVSLKRVQITEKYTQTEFNILTSIQDTH